MTTAENPPLAAPALPEPLPQARRGLLSVLLGVIASPRATFAYLRDHGGASWVWPLMAALALTVAARLVAVPIERAQAEAAMAELQEQLEARESSGEGGEGQVFIAGPGAVPLANGSVAAPTPLATYGLPALGTVWDWVLRGGVLLGLAWVLGGRPSAGAMFRMSGWALLPDIARLAVMLAVMLSTGTVPARGLAGFGATAGGPVVTQMDGQGTEGASSEDGGPNEDIVTFEAGPGGVSFGPGGAADSSALFVGLLRNSLLSAVDVYTLWTLILLVTGVAVTARLSWLKAGIASLAYFGLSIVLASLPPLLSFWLMRVMGGPGPGAIR
jgi:hypothetical protein